jgi:hypothetical protein
MGDRADILKFERDELSEALAEISAEPGRARAIPEPPF